MDSTGLPTILIVDDEPDIREILCFNLEQAGYRCVQAADGRQALEQLTVDNPSTSSGQVAQCTVNLVLLDVMMPGMSGYDVARSIRNDEVTGVPYDLPIIFLTALGEEDDMLRGFKIGADDYICKPFSIKEVIARTAAVLNRYHSHPFPSEGKGCSEPPIGLLFDDKLFTAAINGCDLGLTKMEYELLHFMVTHHGVVYSRSDLLSQVWPENGLVLERTVDVTITRLRKKIGPYKDRIKTKTGYGYYWEK